MAEDAFGVAMFAVMEGTFREPAERDFGFHNLDSVSAAGHFVAIGAAVKRNDTAGRCLTAAAAQKDVIFQRCAGELAFLQSAHLVLNVRLDRAVFGDCESCLRIILVLEREATEKGLYKLDFAVRQLKSRRFGIELQGVARLAVLFEADALMIFARGIFLVAIGAGERFAIGTDHRVGEVPLMIEPKGVWVGNFF